MSGPFPRGIFAPMCTPFINGELDLLRARRHAAELVRQGSHGILVAGSGGEFIAMSIETDVVHSTSQANSYSARRPLALETSTSWRCHRGGREALIRGAARIGTNRTIRRRIHEGTCRHTEAARVLGVTGLATNSREVLIGCGGEYVSVCPSQFKYWLVVSSTAIVAVSRALLEDYPSGAS